MSNNAPNDNIVTLLIIGLVAYWGAMKTWGWLETDMVLVPVFAGFIAVAAGFGVIARLIGLVLRCIFGGRIR